MQGWPAAGLLPVKENNMNSFIIDMQSMTKAEKARRFLAAKGIRSAVNRTQHKGQGCSFSLTVFTGNRNNITREYVCDLLRKIGVDCDIS